MELGRETCKELGWCLRTWQRALTEARVLVPSDAKAAAKLLRRWYGDILRRLTDHAFDMQPCMFCGTGGGHGSKDLITCHGCLTSKGHAGCIEQHAVGDPEEPPEFPPRKQGKQEAREPIKQSIAQCDVVEDLDSDTESEQGESDSESEQGEDPEGYMADGSHGPPPPPHDSDSGSESESESGSEDSDGDEDGAWHTKNAAGEIEWTCCRSCMINYAAFEVRRLNSVKRSRVEGELPNLPHDDGVANAAPF